MELDIMKNTFLEIEKINTLKSHVDKLLNKKIIGQKVLGDIEIDISYRDSNGTECFKSVPFKLDLELDGLKIDDINLKNTSIYVVENIGISVDYTMTVYYEVSEDKEVEIIEINNLDNEPKVVKELNKHEMKEELKEAEIEKIKEDISKDYENMLADNLNQRDNKIAIVATKKSNSETNFLRFFDDNIASYYSIKTLHCSNEEMLNTIAKEYKIPINILLKGYDRENGKVTFKLNK